jgi:hypothetical protein
MAKPKYDGVVEAVHYGPDGQVDWVRVFERRGPTWSDRIILKRDDFIQKLKAGKKYFAGQRIPQMAGTFEVTVPVQLIADGGQEILSAGDRKAEKDNLEGVPLI